MTKYYLQRNVLKTSFKGYNPKETDRARGIAEPEKFKAYDNNSIIVDLPKASSQVIKNKDIFKCINNRRSVRLYSNDKLSLKELSYLLWASQGISDIKGNLVLKNVPCSGATHSFETYLLINNVDKLEKGIYRYLAKEHKLLYISRIDDIDEHIDILTLEQPFVPNFAKKAAVVFAWSTIPYRAEWKFAMTAHKKILIDVGHICQNLYLASESIDVGACAIGIYDQNAIDSLIALDGEDEFIIYMAAVGKKRQ